MTDKPSSPINNEFIQKNSTLSLSELLLKMQLEGPSRKPQNPISEPTELDKLHDEEFDKWLATQPNEWVMETENQETESNLESENQNTDSNVESVGQILSVQDGVAFVSGLENVRVGELVEFVDKQLFGMALNLDKEKVGIILFGDDSVINQGDSVKALGKLVDVECGDHLLGHVTDGIGHIIDT